MRTAAQDLLGEERVVEMRMWGPTEELMRNNSFQQDNNNETAPATNSATTSGAVEMTQRRVTVGDQST